MVSRRSFLGAAAGAFALVGSGMHAAHARAMDPRWAAVRDAIGSGAMGAVQTVSAIVPLDKSGAARRVPFGNSVPAAIAHTLDDILLALTCPRPMSVRTADHDTTGAFALTCVCERGPRIAIAGVSATTPFSATFRGSAGSIHVSAAAIAVESNGQWRDVPF